MYRFRKIESLLEYKELEEQEIYFASPDKLNDPMEGFNDMFWSGDEVVWKNLLKHYLLCLNHFWGTFLRFETTNDEKRELTESDILILKIKENLETSNEIKLYEEICKIFFANETISKFPSFLASRKNPIRRNELSFHLKSLHLHALNAIFSAYEKHAGIKNIFQENKLKDIDLESLSQINRLEEEHLRY